MKKHIKKTILLVCLFLSAYFMVPNKVYAGERDPLTEAIKSSAMVVSLDTEYTLAGTKSKCYDKITLAADGILDIKLKKPKCEAIGNAEKTTDMNIKIYNEQGQHLITYYDTQSDKEDVEIHSGLRRGTYYIMLHYTTSTKKYGDCKYKYYFQASTSCELEPNESNETATPMMVNTVYTGYYYNGRSATTNGEETYDAYSVSLIQGHAYYVATDVCDYGSAKAYILGNNVTPFAAQLSQAADKFGAQANTTFIAPYTGTYYVNIYSRVYEPQIKYTIVCKDVTPAVPSNLNVVAGVETVTASWTATECEGYELQYSTSENFAAPVSVDLLGSGNITSTINSLQAGTYYFRVRAYIKNTLDDVEAIGTSGWSSVATAAVTAPQPEEKPAEDAKPEDTKQEDTNQDDLTTDNVEPERNSLDEAMLYKNVKVKDPRAVNLKGKRLRITWRKNSHFDGYAIQITANKKKPGKANYVNGGKLRFTKGKLKKGKTYYVRIAGYINYDNNGKTSKYVCRYSKWMKVKIKR